MMLKKSFKLNVFYSVLIASIGIFCAYLFLNNSIKTKHVKILDEFKIEISKNSNFIQSKLSEIDFILQTFKRFYDSSNDVSENELEIFSKGLLTRFSLDAICLHDNYGNLIKSEGSVVHCNSFDILESTSIIKKNSKIHSLLFNQFVESGNGKKFYLSISYPLANIQISNDFRTSRFELFLNDTDVRRIERYLLKDSSTKDMVKKYEKLISLDRVEDIELSIIGSVYFEKSWLKYITSNEWIATIFLLLTFFTLGFLFYRESARRFTIERIVDVRTKELASSVAEAKRYSRAKSEFLANMSHEIRTPLNGVLGMLQLIEDSSLDESVKDMVRTCHLSAQNLKVILNDILDFSKLESGNIKLNKRNFSICDILTHSKQLFELVAMNKGLELELNLPEFCHLYIGDDIRIGQVVNNYISNSIKFSDSGKVKISLKITEREKGKDLVLICVEDSGRGISKKEAEKLFLPFSQVDSSLTKKYEGTGLGLSICKKIADLMNAEVFLDSDGKSGSKFFFKIYLERVKEKRNSFSDDRLIPKSRVKKILIVEDNPVNQKLITLMLKKINIVYDIAENGEVAVLKAIQNKYDLVLMDLQMPIMNGIDATVEIRRQLELPPPIVAVTANAFDEDREKCLSVGMVDFITKPLSLNKLKEIIDKTSRA